MEQTKEAGPILPDLDTCLSDAAAEVDTVFARAKSKLASKIMPGGKLKADLLDREQHAAHALAWLATYAATIRGLARYSERLGHENRFGEIERLSVQIAAGEYLNQILGGIPMNQGEWA